MRYAVPILLGLLVATCAHSVSAPVESGEESAESAIEELHGPGLLKGRS
jgi:hypothetical protein